MFSAHTYTHKNQWFFLLFSLNICVCMFNEFHHDNWFCSCQKVRDYNFPLLNFFVVVVVAMVNHDDHDNNNNNDDDDDGNTKTKTKLSWISLKNIFFFDSVIRICHWKTYRYKVYIESCSSWLGSNYRLWMNLLACFVIFLFWWLIFCFVITISMVIDEWMDDLHVNIIMAWLWLNVWSFLWTCVCGRFCLFLSVFFSWNSITINRFLILIDDDDYYCPIGLMFFNQ